MASFVVSPPPSAAMHFGMHQVEVSKLELVGAPRFPGRRTGG